MKPPAADLASERKENYVMADKEKEFEPKILVFSATGAPMPGPTWRG
jgi:hypothetical protein